MKRRLLALSLAAGVTAFMTACGEETTNTDIIKASSADNVDSLPKCDKSYEGMLATIPSKGQILVCHQGEWENVAKTIQSSSKSSANSSDASCTAKENSDKSGVAIVCDGKTIATLKNGAKGAEGQTGPRGGAGNPGAAGSNGSGTNGKDLKLDETDCSVTYVGFDMTLYKCGDAEYIESQSGSKANLKTWNALSFDGLLRDNDGVVIGDVSTYFLKPASGTCEGKVERWKDNDSWKVDEAIEAYTQVDVAELKHNFAVKGTATLIVGDNVKPRTDVKLEPAVGALFSFTTAKSVQGFGGLCLTYSSEQPMELVLSNGTDVARSPLAASTSKKTVDLLVNDFKPDSANVKLSTLAGQVKVVFVKAVGSIEAGEYTNTFAVYELGAYGRCGGETYDGFKSMAQSVAKKGKNLVDNRTDPANTYSTVIIGDQTWMAENLRLPYPYTSKGGDPMALCPDAKATVEEKAVGCLYSWAAVLDSASQLGEKESTDPAYNECGYGASCDKAAPIQGICPNGWHVPSVNEYKELQKIASYDSKFPTLIPYALGAFNEDFTNLLGFSMKGTGITTDFANRSYYPDDFDIWLSNESTDASAWNVFASTMVTDNFGTAQTNPKNYGFAVRCIQNKAKE